MQVDDNGATPTLSEACAARCSMKRILEAEDGGISQVGSQVVVAGWVKTGREQGSGAHEPWVFLELNDGSTFYSLQVMIFKTLADQHGGLRRFTTTGTSVMVQGTLKETPEGVQQRVELKADKVIFLHTAPGNYPLAKKRHTEEYLREVAHLRPRTNSMGAVFRIRNALAQATHTFFNENGFQYVHSPIITASDCEGAGEMLQVTTLLSKAEEIGTVGLTDEQMVELDSEISQQGSAVKSAKEAQKENKEDKAAAAKVTDELNTLKSLKEKKALAQRQRAVVGGIQRLQDGESIDYSEDFFGRPAFLTVSGQLNAEYLACALTNVYTFGPTFRAENSHTARHLAEFIMIEPEMAWCDLAGDMQVAEDYVRFCCRYVLQHCKPDLDFINLRIDKTAIARLEEVATKPFKRLSYTDAVAELEKAVKGGQKFEFPVSWGVDLASEHERYLTEKVYKQPLIVYNYPKDIKAFYMRLNEDGKTVAAMDVLVPKIGELIGGAQREERLELLEQRIKESGMEMAPYAAYLDLRKFGTVPHAGFGLGFERLVMFATGIENIRDVIPFPRWPGHADF
ncbi:hypothetical protein WJX73_004913 [Symbiochloris irregularis]|uniref:asparagine--tRNA ligase n=1 Tax=Symbiochloris irregularis TaxID=706552 RepID=A0AAW1PEM1_9CHLO